MMIFNNIIIIMILAEDMPFVISGLMEDQNVANFITS